MEILNTKNEYFPSSKKNKIHNQSRTRIKKLNANFPNEKDHKIKRHSSSDSPQKIKRGQRLQRTHSSSSKSSRYRELRDKNNEASRKSRLNRKLKELKMEEEATLLEEYNLKVKAEVKHLENLVSSMRSNLMLILLKK